MTRRGRAGFTPRLAGPAVLLAALIALAGCGGDGEDAAESQAGAASEEVTAAAEEGGEATAEAESTPLPRRTVEIFYPSATGDGLVGELRTIFDTVTPGDRAKQIVADLISGPETNQALRGLPRSTRLRQVFVLDDGVAYLDFSADLSEDLGGGSMREILAVYSIVNSVALNLPEVRRVGILINGRPVSTLNGHLDLRRPLRPDHKLILGSLVVRLRDR